MDTITLTGLVATTPVYAHPAGSAPLLSFRLASTIEKLDPVLNETVYQYTNWYTVTARGALATFASLSLAKGDRVVVIGSVRLRDWESGEKNGTTIEIEASTIGHDLRYGRAAYSRDVVA